ncbi:MAG TPA: acyl-CoA dehydrogenase family protein [Candidatus Cybelea sp.]|nr:acyl-CoA dehydrogenase family protein [Candidatus Cybelea sp.]
MALALTEEQQLLKQTALDFFGERSPVRELRKLRDSKDATGFSRALWKQMAELGWAGIIFPESYGGSDFGYFGLGLVLEAAGRTLAATPLVSTVLLCGSAVMLAGSEAQRRAILPAIASGQRIMALAFDEGPRHAPFNMALRAAKSDKGWTLDGEKVFVLDGHIADQLIVAARTSGKPGERAGITLFLVDGNAGGVTRTRSMMVDSRNAARIGFKGVRVGADAVLGEADRGGDVLEAVLDRGRIGLAAEMLGSALEAFERTVKYLKERKQFGVPIGSFQALKHRAAEMFCEIELAKSVVLDALTAIDERRNDVAQVASLAKARLCDTLFLVSNEGVQMHGGIGMTDEEEIGFFMKRARVAAATFGDAGFHRDRYAGLEGY